MDISDSVLAKTAGSIILVYAYDVANSWKLCLCISFLVVSIKIIVKSMWFCILDNQQFFRHHLGDDTIFGIFLSDIIITDNYAFVNAVAIYDYDFLVGTVGS